MSFTRRTALIGLSTALTVTPAIAAANKHPAEEIRELADRIADLMCQLPPGFFDHIEIEKNKIAHFYAEDIRRMREPVEWPADRGQ